MKQLTVRGVPGDLARALVEEKERRSQSLNRTVLELLRQVLGLGGGGRFDNGLSALAGRWSEDELRDFEGNTASFDEIDEELWR